MKPFLLCCAIVLSFSALRAADTPVAIDVPRAKDLMERSKRGEVLKPEDQAYLEQVRREVQKRNAARGQGAASPSSTAAAEASAAQWTSLVALTDLVTPYKGEDGGLYGGGKNEPPEAHRAAYLNEAAKIQPLDVDGKPAADGKIAFITIGFSNTHLESEDFKETADADPQKSPHLVIIDGAIGSRSAVMWAYDGSEWLPEAEQKRLDAAMDLLHMPKGNRHNRSIEVDRDTWPTLDARLKEAGVTASQVQALWMKHVEAQPRPLGDFPAHAKALEADMADILIVARKRFPNLHVAYLSSRTFGGWSGPNSGSPEPFAYESGFAVRWLIQRQIAGDPKLNYDPARGEVTVPLLLWGPYLWANGNTARQFDGGTWTIDDVRSNDHLHPSDAGCHKITQQLLTFLKTDPGSRRWWLKAE